MADLEDLYQDIILEHNRRPRNFGLLQGATHHADGRNPLCGDELSVSLRMEGNRIAEVHFTGQGCAISKASASLMTEMISGTSEAEARKLVENVLSSLQSQGREMKLETMGDLAALSGVRKYPARVKCATLAWHALIAALEGGASVSTEHE